MSRRVNRVHYQLNTKNIESLPDEEIKAILRGADPLIISGGRNLLSKILKGSRAKKVLELELDKCPVYGYYHHLTLENILARIDWVIVNGYLNIEYDYRLPLLVYTKLGWEIEKETYTDELLAGFDKLLDSGFLTLNTFTASHHMNYLKDRDRGMIMLLLDKVEATEDPKYIPVLKAWELIEYKKVQKRIRQVIGSIEMMK